MTRKNKTPAPVKQAPRPGRKFRPSSEALAAIGLSMAVTLAVQLVYFFRVAPGQFTDWVRYSFMAQSLIAGDFGHWIHYHYPPLYPVWLAPFMLVFEKPETAGTVAGILVGMLTVVPLYFLARELFGRTAALAAAALYPFTFYVFPLELDAQPFLNLLLYTSVLAGWKALVSMDLRYIIVTGALFGLSSLAKMDAQAFFGAYFLVLAVRLLAARIPWKAAVLSCGLLWAAFLAVMSPYLISYYLDTGNITLNPKFSLLFMAHNEPNWDAMAYQVHSDGEQLFTLFQKVVVDGDRKPVEQSAVRYVLDYSKYLIPQYLGRLRVSFVEVFPDFLAGLTPGFWWLAGAVILAGLVRPGWTKDQMWRELYLAAFVLIIMVSVPLFHPWHRFFSPMMPALAIFFGRGAEQLAMRITELSRKIFSREKRRMEMAVLSLVIAGLVAPGIVSLCSHEPDLEARRKLEHRREMMEFMEKRIKPHENIMSMWQDLPYWYLAGWLPERDFNMAWGPLDEVILYARSRGVKYILLERGDYLVAYPDLVPLFDPSFRHPDLELIFARPGPRGFFDRVIYEIGPPGSSSGQRPPK